MGLVLPERGQNLLERRTMGMRGKWVIVGICLIIIMMFLGAPFVSLAQDKSAALQRLHEAAKKEGQLVLHDGSSLEQITPIIQAFEKRFPGVKVQVIVQPSPSIISRIIIEAQARKLSIDAGKANISHLPTLNDRGLLRKPDLTKVVDIDPANIWEGGLLHVHASVVPGILYNTNLVAKGDEPRTWDDLLNPKWKGGKIFISGFGSSHAAMFFTREESDVVNYLKQLRKQELTVKRDPRSCTADVASGEAFIGEAFSRVIKPFKDAGAPVELTSIGPQVYVPDGTYALNNSPHPNAAELWIAWLMTPEGRATTLKVSGFAPENKCTNSPSAQWLCDKGIKFKVLETLKEAILYGEYQTKVQEVLGLVPAK
jgi:iron(III) transport system substrate-binding protein